MNKEVKNFLADAEKIGFRLVCVTGRKHLRLQHDETGVLYFTGGTPSDVKARKNALSEMKRLVRAARG